jgi:hypothetical protein
MLMPPIYTYQRINYIRLGELPAEERRALEQRLLGQSAPLIPALDPQDAVYAHDYEHWRRDHERAEDTPRSEW